MAVKNRNANQRSQSRLQNASEKMKLFVARNKKKEGSYFLLSSTNTEGKLYWGVEPQRKKTCSRMLCVTKELKLGSHMAFLLHSPRVKKDIGLSNTNAK